MNDLRLLFRYGKPYRRDLWAAAGLIFVECIFEMVIPVLMSTLVDEGVPSHNMGIILRQGGLMALCAVLALIIAVWKAQRSDGRLEKLGGLRIVSSGADYKLIYAVLAVCAVVIAAALFAAAIAYYALWALAIGTFLLAVYYTVKMM